MDEPGIGAGSCDLPDRAPDSILTRTDRRAKGRVGVQRGLTQEAAAATVTSGRSVGESCQSVFDPSARNQVVRAQTQGAEG
jgi:hypothetical protein